MDPWLGTGSKDTVTIKGKNVFGRLLEQVRREKLGRTVDK
jgi:hypothetical protein